MTPLPNPLPRWTGFNLIKLFTHTHTGDSILFCDQLDWVAEWGFDFVRLPLSYRRWATPENWRDMDEASLAQIVEVVDQAIARKLHICVNLHRAPGYCVSTTHGTEPFSVWRDAEALEASTFHWLEISRRLKDRPWDLLSYNLFNEPPRPGPEVMTRDEHERVIRHLVAAIRTEGDTHRIIVDGVNWGTRPCPELADLAGQDVHQSCRAYSPFLLTHYKARWVNGADTWPEPTWPGAVEPGHDAGPRAFDRTELKAWYQPWVDLLAQGVGVHCGEAGCYNQTPRAVMMAWWRDLLDVLADAGIGWAVWGLVGPFGVIDNGRSGIQCEPWHGHTLDREFLELLRSARCGAPSGHVV